MEPKLDPSDISLLEKMMRSPGEYGPKNEQEKQQLPRLVAEGYVEAVSHKAPPGSNAPPGVNYRLTDKGRLTAQS
jgi:hypothetical protein